MTAEFEAGRIWERTTGPVTRAMNELADKWDCIATEHGERAFTGNDHRLFANELRAALQKAIEGG